MINPFQLYTRIPDNVPILPDTKEKFIQCVKHKTKYAQNIRYLFIKILQKKYVFYVEIIHF